MTLNRMLQRRLGPKVVPIRQRRNRLRAIGSVIRCVVGALLCLAGLGSSAAVAAQLVEPGTSVVIETTSEAIANPAAKLGKLVVIENADGDKRSLVYVAPGGISGFKDNITYTLGAEEKTLEIEGRAGARTFGSTELYEASFKAIFVLFILAVVVESGLQLIFRWRPYLRTFNTASVNTIVALAFSLFFVSLFDLDIVTKLVNAYTAPANTHANSPVGLFLTAMIIAGGSAGVNRLFRAFGFRPITPPAEIAGPRDETQAWVSVTLRRDKAVGAVDVLFGEAGKEAVIGTISGTSSKNPAKNLFFRDNGRFPRSGGYTVTVAENCALKLVGKDETGKVLPSRPWGPYDIGPRAIIDVECTL